MKTNFLMDKKDSAVDKGISFQDWWLEFCPQTQMIEESHWLQQILFHAIGAEIKIWVGQKRCVHLKASVNQDNK